MAGGETSNLSGLLSGFLRGADLGGYVDAVRAAADQVPLTGAGCKAGCTPCCHLRVTVTAPEILSIADDLRRPPRGERLPQSVWAAHEVTNSLDDAGRAVLRHPCPLLDNTGRCSVYPARPVSCRLHTARNGQACAELAAGKPGDPQPLEIALRAQGDLVRAQLRALAATGFSATTYELNDGLARALQTPDATALWFAGTDVFAGVQPGAASEVLRILKGDGV